MAVDVLAKTDAPSLRTYPRTVDQVVQDLEEGILLGQIGPGERFIEDAIAKLEAFAVSVCWRIIDRAVIDRLPGHLAAMRVHRFFDDIPQMIKLDFAFHQTLVETAHMPRRQVPWSSLNGQIGALYIRAIEEQRFDATAVAALHEKIVTVLQSGDPRAAQRAILVHYVRADEGTSLRA